MAAMASAISEGEGGAASLAKVVGSKSESGEGGATGVTGAAEPALGPTGPCCLAAEGNARDVGLHLGCSCSKSQEGGGNLGC